jgi:serralysin
MPDIFETVDAAGNTSTGYTLQTGQTVQGTLSAPGDHDWYAVNLAAGQTYTFALVGTEMSAVPDTYLQLYGPGGSSLVAFDDDGLPNLNSLITYTATSSGTYYIDAGAYSDFYSGQYGVSVAIGTRATVDIEMGAGIIDTHASWSPAPGTGATVTVGFAQTASGDGDLGFSTFTTQQIAATQAVLQYYSDVCNITFNVLGNTDNAAILLSNYNQSDGSGGHAYYPGSTDPASLTGDVHINRNANSATSLPVGSYEFYTLMHELGHAVGLSHPGLYNAGPGQTITYATDAEFIQDTQQYTVMSYFDESNAMPSSWGSYPDTLMLYDIYALQQIYGANMSTRAGDTVYGFHSNAGSDVYDFATNTVPVVCIWDGGGIDTLDLSGYSASENISLIGGTFSNVGGQMDNVSIAYGAVIENAIGGSSSDLIHLSADAVDNLVNGNGGSDTVWVSYDYGSGYTLLTGSTASDLIMLGAAGIDTLLNCESVHFANGTTVSTASLLASTPVAHPTHDFNGDGTNDILVREEGSGAISYGAMSQGSIGWNGLDTLPEWTIEGVGDFDANGHDNDLLVRQTGTDYLSYGEVSNGSISWHGLDFLPAAWTIQGLGDFDADGDRNAFLVRQTNTGYLSYGEVSNGSISWHGLDFLPTDWTVQTLGDFDGDGHGNDVLVQETSTGYLSYGEVGNGSISWHGLDFLPAGWAVQDVGDFDGDGLDNDVLVQQASTGYLSYGEVSDGSISWHGLDVLPGWTVQSVGDFDGDGLDNDVLVRQASTGYLSYGEVSNDSISWHGLENLPTSWLVVG